MSYSATAPGEAVAPSSMATPIHPCRLGLPSAITNCGLKTSSGTMSIGRFGRPTSSRRGGCSWIQLTISASTHAS